MREQTEEKLTFENLWQKNPGELHKEIVTIWRQFSPDFEADQFEERLTQLVYIVKNEYDQVVGLSTAHKVFIKQLRGYMYSVRMLVIPNARQPGLPSKIMVETRNFIESIHEKDISNKAMGIITLVENKDYAQMHREAIWPASQMVYIGNSGNGFQVRVYYFKGAVIS